MKKAFIFPLALLVTLISCSKQERENPYAVDGDNQLVRVTFYAEREQCPAPETKVYPNWSTSRYIWVPGEKIAVFSEGSKYEFTNIMATESARAEFQGDIVLGDTYYACYPCSSAVSISGSVINATLPATQVLDGHGNDPVSYLSVAKMSPESGTDFLCFKNVFSLIKFELADPDVTEIVVMGNNGEDIAGTVNITMDETEDPSFEVVEGYKTITLTPTDSTFTADTAYTVAVLPQAAKMGITLLFKHSGSLKTAARKTSSTFDIIRNQYLETSPFDFETDDYKYYFIKTKADLLTWNNDFANWSSVDKVLLQSDIELDNNPETEVWTAHGFSGTFEGNNHSITKVHVSNEGSASFFGATTGTIRDLTIGAPDDGSCFSCTSAPGSAYIALISTLSGKGNVSNVTSYANMSFSGSGVNTVCCAGIIGASSSSGSVKNCANYGTVSVTGTLSSAFNVGGILGSNTYAAVSSCTNNGNLTVNAAYSQSLNYGGIIGYDSKSATISSCINNGNLLLSGSPAPSGGQTSVGGILGYNNNTACSIKLCTNNGTVTKSASNTKRDSYIGGILGYSNAVATLVSGCTNSATVSNTGSCSGRQMYLGGVVGYVNSAASVVSCTNTAGVSNSSLSTNIMLGGIAGRIVGAAVIGGEGQPCVNSGNITNSGMSSNVSVNALPNINIGGIAGASSTAAISYCSNSGTVTNTGTLSTSKTSGVYKQAGNYICTAGIAGTVNGRGSVTDCQNTGAIASTAKTVPARYCTAGIVGYNYGARLADFSRNTNASTGTLTVSGTEGAFGNYIGGMIALVAVDSTNISSCINEAIITNSASRVAADTLPDRSKPLAMCIGGIVGKQTGLADIIDCTNSAKVYSSGKAYVAGANLAGIIAEAAGTISVKACTNSGLVREEATPIAGLVSCLGGIAGKASGCVSISDGCENSGEVSRHSGAAVSAKYYLGGILGYNHKAGSSIDNCSNTGLINSWARTSGNAYPGGILGVSDCRITVTGCSNSGAVKIQSITGTGYTGGIIGSLASGSTGSVMTSCENTGAILVNNTVTNLRMAGVIGDAYGSFTFTDCTNRGTVTNTSDSISDIRVSGFEASSTNNQVTLIRCKNYGKVISATSSGKTVSKGYYAGLLGYKGNSTLTMTDCENYGDVEVRADAITTQYLAGLSALSPSGSAITGCKVSCSISSTVSGSYIGQVAGYGISTTINKTGLSGNCNGTALTESNWKSYVYGTIATSTAKVDVSEGDNSCYFLNDSGLGIGDYGNNTDNNPW